MNFHLAIVLIIAAFLLGGYVALIVAALMKSASLNEKFIEPEDLMDGPKHCPDCGFDMTHGNEVDLYRCENCNAFFTGTYLSGIEQRPARQPHKLEVEGSNPSPAKLPEVKP